MIPPISLRRESQPFVHAAYLGMINRRAELCRDTERSNCFGTARYLTGGQKKDLYIDPFVESDFDLTMAKGPILGGMVAWLKQTGKSIQITHIGVVTAVNPILVTHRAGADSYFVENEPFDIVNADYAKLNSHGWITYYLPRALSKT